MNDTLTRREIQIVAGKAKGQKQRDIARQVYPNATLGSGEVEVSRTLRKPKIQSALAKELKKQGITLKRALKPVRDGLEASKTVIIGKGDDAFADNVADHGIRLQASRMALDLLGRETEQQQQKIDNAVLSEALKNGSELELLGAVFGKKEIKPVMDDMENKEIIDQV